MVGDRIADFIDSGQFSKSSLARELGVSRSLVGKWVSNKSRPSPQHIEQMANLFKVGAAYLAGFESTPRVNPVDIVSALSAARLAREQLDKAIRALENVGVTESKVVPLYLAADGGKINGPDRVAESLENNSAYTVEGEEYEERTDLGDSGKPGRQGGH